MRKTLLTLALLCGLSMSSNGHAIGAPGGSTITNMATFNFATTSTGDPVATESNRVELQVNQVVAITITADGTIGSVGQTSEVQPGDDGVLTYTVTNNGNDVDSVMFWVDGEIQPTSVTFDGTVLEGTPFEGKTWYTTADLDADASGTLKLNYQTKAPTANTTQGYTNFVAGTPAGFLTYGNPQGYSTTYLMGSTDGGLTSTTPELIGSQTYTTNGNTITVDYSARDLNNVGEVIVGKYLELASDQTTQNTSYNFGNTIIFEHNITNASNFEVAADQITVASNDALPGYTKEYQVSYRGNTPVAADTLEDAINQALGSNRLGIGETLDIINRYTADPTTTTGGTVTYNPYSEAIDDEPTLSNNALSGQINFSDTIDTPTAGAGTISKAQAKCTTIDNATTCPTFDGPFDTATLQVIPSDRVVYRINGTNPGPTPLYNANITDNIPTNFNVTNIVTRLRVECNAVGPDNARVLLSNDGTTWTNVNVPSLSIQSNQTLYAALDSNGNNTIDADDLLPPRTHIEILIEGQVRYVNLTSDNSPPAFGTATVTHNPPLVEYCLE